MKTILILAAAIGAVCLFDTKKVQTLEIPAPSNFAWRVNDLAPTGGFENSAMSYKDKKLFDFEFSQWQQHNIPEHIRKDGPSEIHKYLNLQRLLQRHKRQRREKELAGQVDYPPVSELKYESDYRQHYYTFTRPVPHHVWKANMLRNEQIRLHFSGLKKDSRKLEKIWKKLLGRDDDEVINVE
tara:strand:+ start:223 stop:771 length:549 start_codon:yes stop_codon:yes gene_type:complete